MSVRLVLGVGLGIGEGLGVELGLKLSRDGFQLLVTPLTLTPRPTFPNPNSKPPQP